MLAAFKNINLAIRFFLELAMLTAFAYWRFYSEGTFALRLLSCIGLPLFIVLVWGIFLSPKAKVKLPMAVRVLMEFALFLGASWALYTLGLTTIGLALALTFVVNRTILLLLRA